MELRTIIFYTDTISALVLAGEPLLHAIEAATERGDNAVIRCLNASYLPLRKKLKALADEGKCQESWTPAELLAKDAETLARIVA